MKTIFHLSVYHKNSPIIRAFNHSATLLALSVGDPSPTSCTRDLFRDEFDLDDVEAFFLSSPPSLLPESLLELFVLSESLSEVKSLLSPGLGGDSGESGSIKRAKRWLSIWKTEMENMKTTKLTGILCPVTIVIAGHDSNIHLDHPLLSLGRVVNNHVLPVADSLLQSLLFLLHSVWII